MFSGKNLLKMSLPAQVLISALLGILAGLLFRNSVAILQPIGTIYSMLMEVVAIPYVTCTLITSLGSLTPALSLRLFKKSWGIYFFLLFLTFGVMLLLSEAMPLNIQSSQEKTLSSETNLLNVLFPSNLFYSLTTNRIPAIIIFCILFGLTFQFMDQKTTFFSVLDSISKASLLFWNGLIKFTPIATFALLSNIFGHITRDQIMNLSEFLILFFIGTLLLVFWIIPVVISSLTSISYRSLLFELSHALIISAATTLSVVALPYIRITAAKFLATAKQKDNSVEIEDTINTITTIGYPFAQLGNFFIYIFILFALLYFNHTLDHFHYLVLPLISYFSSIGSPSTSIDAVQLLATWLELPVENTVNLYISLMPLIRYTQVLASVMGFAFLSILISFALFDHLRVNYRKLLVHLFLVFILIISIVLGLKGYFPTSGEKIYARLNHFSINPNLVKDMKVSFAPPFDEAKVTPIPDAQDALFRIQKTGVLRVGFNADMRPFVFYNERQQLVGYDVEYMYALANSLNARLEFIPFTWKYLIQDLEANRFDIAIGAIYVTEKRLENVNFTHSYFRSPISVVVPVDRQHQFQTVSQMNQMPNLRIGVFDDPVLIPLIRKNLPHAKIVILPTLSTEVPAQAFEENKVDAILWSQAQTQVWAWKHPNYVSITPTGLAAPFLMAYMVSRDSPEFLEFLNYWLELKKNDGFQEAMNNKWILGVQSNEDSIEK